MIALWTAVICTGTTAGQDCTDATVANALVDYTATPHTSGSTATVNCIEGYSVEVSPTMTCTDGYWDVIPKCYQNCPSVAMNYGTVSQYSKTPHTVGSTALVSCFPGYTSSGPRTLSCLYARWYGFGRCVPDCNDVAMENGAVTWYSATPHIHESAANVTCNSGYSLSGDTTIYCKGGSWNGLPTCDQDCAKDTSCLDCSDATVNNGSVTGYTATPHTSGSTATVSCNSGYSVSGSPTITCTDGSWDALTNCTQDCLDATVGNGSVTNYTATPHTSGSEATVSCNSGYSVSGPPTITCTDGSWGALPNCNQDSECIDATVNNGSVTKYTATPHTSGSTATVSCNSGYSVSGPSAITCTDGSWGALPNCTQDCSDAAVEDGLISNYTATPHASGSTATVSCNPGHTVLGSSRITCTDGSWATLPTCTHVCNDTTVANGSVSDYTAVPHIAGSTAKFSCNSGYSVPGSPFIICIQGRWEAFSKCAQDCIDATMNNGSFTNYTATPHTSGSTATVSCNSGYSVSGPSAITCIDGSWKSSSTCAQDCIDATVNNGSVTNYTATPHTSGSEATVSCNAGYSVSGPPTITCTDGSWGALPNCNQVCTDAKVGNGSVTGYTATPHTNESTATVGCNPGYSLSGSSTITCTDGSWGALTPTCTKECIDAIVGNGSVTGYSATPHISETTATVSCNSGYSLSGPPTITCTNGSWGALPTCAQDCLDATVDDGSVTNYTATPHTSGSTATVSCDSGYSVSGPPTITCLEGSWGAVPTCTKVLGVLPMIYGVAAADENFTITTTDECLKVSLGTCGILVDDVRRKNVYICENGLVTFAKRYRSNSVPISRDAISKASKAAMLAPYFSNIDARTNGQIYYHMYEEDEINSKPDVQTKAGGLLAMVGYNVSSIVKLLVVTWERVVLFNKPTTETATFQLLLIADDKEIAVAIFAYQDGGMKFSSNMIGALFPGIFTKFSTSDPVAFFTVSGQKGLYFQRLFRNPKIGGCTKCKNWVRKQRLLPSLATAYSLMPDCPCDWRIALISGNYLRFRNWVFPGQHCYMLAPSWRRYRHAGTVCCYTSGFRSYSSTKPLVGFKSRYHPSFRANVNKFLYDVRMQRICCKNGLCDAFYGVRNANTRCNGKARVRLSWGLGDPHLITPDGKQYTFNGYGEFVLLEIQTATVNLTVQGRTEPVRDANNKSTSATAFTGFAARDSSDNAHFMVTLTPDKSSLDVFANGIDVTAAFDKLEVEKSLESEILTVQLSKPKENVTGAFFSNSEIKIEVSRSSDILTLTAVIPDTYKGIVRGLYGNVNGDPEDDFITRQNITLPGNATDRELYAFGLSWRVQNEEESAFIYAPGDTYANHQNTSFHPNYLDEASQDKRTAAEAICGANNIACIFDQVFTQRDDIALGTKNGLETAANETKRIENTPPELNISSTSLNATTKKLHVVMGTSKTVTLEVSDDGPVTSLKYSIVSGQNVSTIPDSSSTDKIVLTINLVDTNPVTVSVIVADELGATSPEVVIGISLCTGCSNGQGACDYTTPRDTGVDTETFMVAQCVCEPYFEGDNCELDFDGCSDTPCSMGRLCDDVDGATHKVSGKAFTCGLCPAGYVDDGQNGCSDIDECNNSTMSNCSDICVNSEGSYTCKCKNNGRRLGTDGATCIDIDECEEVTHNCRQICNNTDGRFECSCFANYVYDSTANTCNISDAGACAAAGCPTINGGCIIEGTSPVKCFCETGYKLNETNCDNIDECTQSVCSHTCKDTLGSYECGCLVGYKLNADRTTCSECPSGLWGEDCANSCGCSAMGSSTCNNVKGCVCTDGWTGTKCDQDINECDTPDICADVNSVCANSKGSYSCDCREGYQKNASDVCVDYDECDDPDLNTCSQVCENTGGGFICKCNTGYVKSTTDSTQCLDVDECTTGNHGCQQECKNVISSYNCLCYVGYAMNDDRKTCRKLEGVADDCSQQGLTCAGFCEKGATSSACRCGPGYILGTDKQSCLDVNECNTNTHTCSDTCTNFDGGYNCSCPIGNSLGNDSKCTVCDYAHYGDGCAMSCSCSVGAERCDPVTGCVCTTGWTGDKCDHDKNECDVVTSPCTGDHVICLNTRGSFQCNCATGYKKNATTNACEEINECADSALNSCEHTCKNTQGSYQCSCLAGFIADGPKCKDIDECNGVTLCEQKCLNTEGGYKCSCNDGFRLNTLDRVSCIVEIECNSTQSSQCGNNTQCVVRRQGVQCDCIKGFEKTSPTDTECTDIKECDKKPCSHNCIEKEGGFTCSCNVGYRFATDKLTCEACPAWTKGAECTQQCTCSQTYSQSCNASTGTCVCKGGWTGDNCDQDINECSSSTICGDANAVCKNTDGSYVCECNTGFEKREGKCKACTNNKFGVNCGSTCTCEAANTASCNHVNGICVCKKGWSGATCEVNINECDDTTLCAAPKRTQCVDTQGSYRCDCDSGYRLNGDTCQDINECLDGRAGCKFLCNNTDGGYQCYCGAGFSGTGYECTPCTSWKAGIGCAESCTCNRNNAKSCTATTGACVCKTGWKGATCEEDVDECAENPAICDDSNTNCVNNDGSYDCLCKVGYQKGTAKCQACSGGTFGNNCASNCDCSKNTDIQACNHINGTCNCASGWNGTRCDVDIDECATNTHTCTGAHEGCINIDGGFKCSCILGYSRGSSGNCMDVSTPTPPEVTANAVTTAINVELKFDINLGADNLSLKQTYEKYRQEVKTEILRLLQKMLPGQNYEVVIHSIKRGSLIVNYSVAVPTNSTTDVTLLNGDIASGVETVVLFGQNASVSAMSIGDQQVATGTAATSEENVCKVFALIAGPCKSHEICVLVNNREPYCNSLKTDDDFGLVIGLAVGVGFAFIVIVILAVAFVCYSRKQRRMKMPREHHKRHFLDGFPTRLGHRYGNDPYHGPQFEDITSSTDSMESHSRRY